MLLSEYFTSISQFDDSVLGQHNQQLAQKLYPAVELLSVALTYHAADRICKFGSTMPYIEGLWFPTHWYIDKYAS